MAYLGNGLSVADLTKTARRYEQFSGNGSTTNFTLSQAVFTNTDLEVFVENVQQEPIVAFTASGTSLSFTEAPPAGTNNIYVVYRSYDVPYVSIADGTITHAKLAENLKIFTADNYIANGTGQTYVLSDIPADANTIYASIDGVVQRAPENYTLSGNTITFTSAPPAGSNVHVRHLGIRTVTTVFEPLGSSIRTTALADGAVTEAKLGAGSVTESKLGDFSVTSDKINVSIFATSSNIFGVRANANTFGNSIIIISGNTEPINVGMFVAGSNIAPGTTVVSFNTPTTGRSNITLSQAASGSNTNTAISFYENRKALSPGVAGPGLAKAWVNFNGTGAVQIRSAYNVSSITDNGTGDYTVNFTTAMPDSNYVFACSLDGTVLDRTHSAFSWSVTSSSIRVYAWMSRSNAFEQTYDPTTYCVSIFR